MTLKNSLRLLAASVLLASVAGSSVAFAEDQQTDTKPQIAANEAPGATATVPPAIARPAPKTWIRVSPRRCDFQVFTRPQQGFAGRFASAEDAVVVGSPGAVVSIDNNVPILHNGCLFITCKRGIVTLTTRLATVNIPAGLSAMVETVPASSLVRVAVISGDSKQVVKTSSRKGRQFYSLHAGQEVVFSDRTGDQAPHTFDIAKVSPTEDILQLFNGNVPVGIYTKAPLHILGAEATEFRYAAPDTIALRTGELFVSVPDKLVIRTAVGDAVASKGAIIDVDADVSDMRLKAFSGPGHSAIVCGDRSFAVTPGQEMMVAAHEIEQADLNPPDGVGRRRGEKISIDHQLYGASSDFSMISFLNEAPHVQAIKHAVSGDYKLTLEKILKTAAVVQTISSRYGAYRSVERVTRRRGGPGKDRSSGGSA
jgi:hypothetical protein